jgi:diaminohydroxyphosphoribosylaminopyrimidine deaminase / 5-amino-6-(5-phosphoribosylamino)uracil reductase
MGNRLFMEKALETAFSRMGTTSPNPAVGAVIVKDGEIISGGGTCACGCDHAEVEAIKRAGVPLDGAELYVTLEPCCHYGKTPPCTEAIIRAGIRRVYVPITDPNPLVAGKGIGILREAGVEVVMMEEMSGAASDLLRPFAKYIVRNRPHVIHKSGVTLDGRIATRTGDSRWISSDSSRYIVHRLRSIADAVMVGRVTFEKDNPSLNVRLQEFPDAVHRRIEAGTFCMGGRDNWLLRMLLSPGGEGDARPLRIVVGMPDPLHYTENVFFDEHFIVFVEKNRMHLLDSLRKRGTVPREIVDANFVVMEGETHDAEADFILRELGRRGIMNVLLEGGGGLAGAFLDAGGIDHFMYFISPRVFGSGTPVLRGGGADKVAETPLLRDVTTVILDDDVLISGYRESYADIVSAEKR